MATGKRVPPNAKAEAVKQLREGVDPASIAKTMKVSVQTLLKWNRQTGNPPVRPAPGTSVADQRANTVRDCIAFLEIAEKACIEELTSRKRKRLTKAETYMMLALTTLRGG